MVHVGRLGQGSFDNVPHKDAVLLWLLLPYQFTILMSCITRLLEEIDAPLPPARMDREAFGANVSNWGK